MIARTKSGFVKQRSGIKETISDVYFMVPTHYVEHGRHTPTKPGALKARPEKFVIISRPDTYTVLYREDDLESWQVQQAVDGAEEFNVSPFSSLETLPVQKNMQGDPLADLLQHKVLDRTANTVEVRFEPIEGKERNSGDADTVTKEMFVTFARNEHWLPIKVDRLRTVAEGEFAGEGGYQSFRMEKYKRCGDAFVPMRFAISGGEDRSYTWGKPSLEETTLSDLKVLTEEEVLEKASMDSWKLPELVQEAGWSYRLIAVISVAVIAVIGFIAMQVRSRLAT